MTEQQLLDMTPLLSIEVIKRVDIARYLWAVGLNKASQAKIIEFRNT